MGTRNASIKPKACTAAPQPDTRWRSWADGPDGPLVPLASIPKAMMFDLVAALDPWTFAAAATEEDLEAGLHLIRADAHLDRMRELSRLASMHLSDHGIEPNVTNLTRALALVYEVAGLATSRTLGVSK